MAVEVTRWVWKHSKSAGTSRLVLLAIADCSRQNGTGAFPSMAELRRMTGLGERTVQSALSKLVELRELVVHRNTGPKGCNRYSVVMTTPAESAPPQNPHPANPAGGEVHAFPQVAPDNPAESAPPADSAPPQDLQLTPAESAPVSTKEQPSKISKPREPRGSRIPDDFTVTESMKEWVRHNTPSVNGWAETEKFIDYWRAQPGAKGRKTDWVATWRNWMRRASEQATPPRANGNAVAVQGAMADPPGTPAHFQRAMQRALAKEAKQ